jgi:tetratricopeptide (TPR) repeat protein
MLGQVTEAVVECDAALKAQPDSHGINETCGMVYLKAGDLTKAAAGFDMAQIKAPANDGQPLYGRGLVKVKRGELAAAAIDLDKAAAIDPTIADYYARFGLTR